VRIRTSAIRRCPTPRSKRPVFQCNHSLDKGIVELIKGYMMIRKLVLRHV